MAKVDKEMSSSTDETVSTEFDHLEWLGFDMPGFEDYDFSSMEMPNLPTLDTLSEAQDVSTQAALSPLNTKPSQPSPSSQSRRASLVTVQRRSSNKPNEDILSVTLEDSTGRKRSWDINFDSAYEALFNRMSPGRVSTPMQPQNPPPTYQPRPDMSLAQQLSSLSSHLPVADLKQNVNAHSRPTPPRSLVSTTQVVPMLSSPPTSLSQRAGGVPASSQGLPQPTDRPAPAVSRGYARKRPQPSQQRDIQRKGLGGRLPLPNDIALFVNTHHLPNNDGRVPDKRGNKDTTVANDYYYTISKLDDLELPTCGETVSYNGVEFDASRYFSGEEFLEYLLCASRRPNRQPILRIQIQPAQYNHRYKRAGQSFKCRFTNCPDKRGTILKGQARVCISEFDDEHGDWLNPFHNAGYVHLFCLEQQTNFIELYDDYPGITIVPETRSLVHEPPATTNRRLNNPMILNDVEQAVVSDWLAEIGTQWNEFKSIHRNPALRPKFELAQEDTLTYRLTKAHMDNAPLRNIQKKRKLDAGGRVTAHLDEHVGDVGKQVALQKKMKQQPPPNKKSDIGKNAGAMASPEPAAKRRRVTPPPSESPQHQVMVGGSGELQTQLAFSGLLDGGYDPVELSLPATEGLASFQSVSQQKVSSVQSEDAAHLITISPPRRRSSTRSRRATPHLLELSPRGVSKRRA